MDIKTICLAILAQGDATGYEIQKTIKDGPLTHFFDASFGSIYPALSRLADEGMIECTAVNEDGKPERKVYSIQPNGRLHLTKSLANVSMRDKIRSPFLATMIFSSLLTPRELYRLIESRIAVHQSVLDDLDADNVKTMSAGERFVHGYAEALNKAALGYLEQHRTELEGEVLLTSLSPELEETRS